MAHIILHGYIYCRTIIVDCFHILCAGEADVKPTICHHTREIAFTGVYGKTSAFRRNLGKYISLHGKFWQKPVPWIDEAVLSWQGNGAWIAAGYCVNILQNLAEGREVKYFPKFYLSPLLEEI